MPKPLGIHVIIDAYKCDSPLLSDLDGLEEVLVEAVERCGADVIGTVKKQFKPRRKNEGNGVTLGVLLGLGESHASIHSYPETGQWIADVCLCGAVKPDKAVAHLRQSLGGLINSITLDRGVVS